APRSPRRAQGTSIDAASISIRARTESFPLRCSLALTADQSYLELRAPFAHAPAPCGAGSAGRAGRGRSLTVRLSGASVRRSGAAIGATALSIGTDRRGNDWEENVKGGAALS